MTTYQTITSGEDILLREKNPFQHPDGEQPDERSKFHEYETKLIANARILTNPQPEKTEYAENELELVWQGKGKKGKWRIIKKPASAKILRNFEIRQVFKYIGEVFDPSKHIHHVNCKRPLSPDMEQAIIKMAEIAFYNTPAKTETVEEAANRYGAKYYSQDKPVGTYTFHEGFKAGANWAREQNK